MDLGQDIGVRDVDRDYDSSAHVGRYIIQSEIWDQVNAESPVAQAVSMEPL